MVRGALLSLPNLVSLSRFVLAGSFVVAERPGSRLGLIVAAAFSDFLDGWLARRGNAATRWGALIDPLADRAFVLAAAATFLHDGELTWRQVLALLTRDIATAVGYLVARVVWWLRAVPFKARRLGKAVTVLQLATLLVVIVAPTLVSALIALVVAVSAVAIVDYTLVLWQARPRVAGRG